LNLEYFSDIRDIEHNQYKEEEKKTINNKETRDIIEKDVEVEVISNEKKIEITNGINNNPAYYVIIGTDQSDKNNKNLKYNDDNLEIINLINEKLYYKNFYKGISKRNAKNKKIKKGGNLGDKISNENFVKFEGYYLLEQESSDDSFSEKKLKTKGNKKSIINDLPIVNKIFENVKINFNI